jgi:membrane protease YdiL (CAAX protease family)
LFLAILGYYKIVGFNNPVVLLTAFITFGMGAFIEELVFRLILFRLVEEFFGSWAALVVLAVFFGFAHIGNENATVITSLAIVLEAGILIAAAFMYTRRLWLVFGIHFAWNYFQSAIWGVRTSGEEFTGLVNPEITGPVWLTGGDFGTEASVLTVVFCLVIGVILLRLAIKRGQLVRPAWRRPKLEAAPTTE